MNRKEAKEFVSMLEWVDVIKAFSEGKKIQMRRTFSPIWSDVEQDESTRVGFYPSSSAEGWEYRVKPEVRQTFGGINMGDIFFLQEEDGTPIHGGSLFIKIAYSSGQHGAIWFTDLAFGDGRTVGKCCNISAATRVCVTQPAAKA